MEIVEKRGLVADDCVAMIFCNLAKLLPKSIASQKNQHTSHVALLKESARQAEIGAQTALDEARQLEGQILASCKVVTKDHSIPEKPTYIARCYDLL